MCKDLYYRIKTKLIIYDFFGRDISSLIYPYLFGNCETCNVILNEYKVCEGCDKIYCKDCYSCQILKSWNLNYCQTCIYNICLNDN